MDYKESEKLEIEEGKTNMKELNQKKLKKIIEMKLRFLVHYISFSDFL